MPFLNVEKIAAFEVIPGYRARFIHASNMSFAHWEIDAGAQLPEHSHVHEQVAHVMEGEFELTVNGETRTLGAGSVAIIPSRALHSGRAITNCKIVDAFFPVREDYRERFNAGAIEIER